MVGFVPELLPRFFRAQQQAEDRRALARILVETVEESAAPVAGGTASGDRSRLRGVPVIDRGVGGTMAGSDPVAELLRTERRRRRR